MDLFPSIEPHPATLSETKSTPSVDPSDPTRDLTVCQVPRSLPITSAYTQVEGPSGWLNETASVVTHAPEGDRTDQYA